MRLTDLLRDKNGKKKPFSTPLSKAAELSSMETTLNQNVKKGEQVSGHLQADDLAALYDIDNPAQSPGISSISDHHAVIGEQTEVSQRKMGLTGYGLDEHLSGQDIPHMEKTESIPDNPHNASKDEGGIPPVQPSRDSMSADTEKYESMEENERADALHIELLSILDDIYEEGKNSQEISVEQMITPITNIIDLCKTSNAILRKAIRLKKGGRSFTAHSLNVAILAIKIGLSRGYPDERVFSLALCAILGDIGMTQVDPEILNKTGKLTPDEFMEIKRHVEYSVEIVSGISHKFPFLAPIIYQIHERDNGSGYPQGLKGANMHEFAKITGMCDVYIALTEPKANREHYSGYVAMQQIISRRGIDFDSKIIKSLIDVISVFPLESLVRLNNGAIGRVIDISPIHPTRPKLSILINSDGEKLKRPQYLDLEKEPLLYIEGPDVEEGVIL